MYIPKDQQPEKYYNAIPVTCLTQYECDYVDAFNTVSQHHAESEHINGHTPPMFRTATNRNTGSILINSYSTIHRTDQAPCCCNNPKLDIQPEQLSTDGHLYTTETSFLNKMHTPQTFANLEPTYVPQDTKHVYAEAHEKSIQKKNPTRTRRMVATDKPTKSKY